MVTLEDGALAFALAPFAVSPAMIPPDRADAPEGGVAEFAPAAVAYAKKSQP